MVTGDYRGDLPLTGDLEAVTAAADGFGHAVRWVPALVGLPSDVRAVAGHSVCEQA